MEPLLARVTQQTMNYAIRTGITITTTYALKQSSRLLARVEPDAPEYAELRALRDRLEGRIRILGPAIDLVELISARGNSSLETAVTLTKSIRYDMQTLGQQLAAANDAAYSADRRVRVDHIVADIKALLARIEDAVPLINLAITTSGVNLSGGLPAGISPSRLLQASTFVTAGDSQYAAGAPLIQIGPTFTLSLYMLFAGHVRPRNEADIRQTTWKEVLHKARVKLMRVPLPTLFDLPDLDVMADASHPKLSSAPKPPADEFAYQLLIVEDVDDGRVHNYDDGDEEAPSRYGDVAEAGIREPLPIHEISKIFYADTGKILNIGDDVATNSPVLLLKRDIHAVPPRRMLERQELHAQLNEPAPSDDEEGDETGTNGITPHEGPSDAQSQIDAQIDRESRANSLAPDASTPPSESETMRKRRLPLDLDPEWLAFEVYTEDVHSDSESESEDTVDDARSPPLQPTEPVGTNVSTTSRLSSAMSKLKLSTPTPSPKPASSTSTVKIPPVNAASSSSPSQTPSSPPSATANATGNASSFTASLPQIRTSLSLLETMLRLLSLQQFQQSSHLSIPDELLSFFLSEATSTTGAAHGDEAERRTLRNDARRRVGFDPYDESPIKRRGEAYQRYRGGISQSGSPGWGDEWGDPSMADGDGGGGDAHVASIEWERAGWSSPAAWEQGTARTTRTSRTSRSAADEGYETMQRVDGSAKPSLSPSGSTQTREATARKGAAPGSPAAAQLSPSVRAKLRRDREQQGSPLASVESADD